MGFNTRHRPVVISIPKKRPGGLQRERDMRVLLISFWIESPVMLDNYATELALFESEAMYAFSYL